MTDILCKWMNEEVKLSRKIDVTNFAKEFSTGLLIGEVLHKYQLLDDFDQFSQSRAAGSKLNNFTKLEPVLHLLGVSFDTNAARDIMSEKHGAATRLMYQVFIAIHNKEKNNLTGVAIETMRPAAPVKLENIESAMYKERLKQMLPRQTDVNLDNLVAQFHNKQIELESKAFKERFEEEERHIQQLQQQRQQLIQKYKDNQSQKSEMLAKIKSSSSLASNSAKQSRNVTTAFSAVERAATVRIPKPPSSKTAKSIAMQRQARRLKEQEEAMKDIDAFEDTMNRTLPPSKPMGSELSEMEDRRQEVADLPDTVNLVRPKNNDDYIDKIRKRLSEDYAARSEREKRRRKVLVDQLKAHELQEEARREEMMVNRLMRQSQQERRIAVQLLQTRHEKEIIKRNRLQQEKQCEERRLKEFEEALNREAELERLAKLNYMEQNQKDIELHNKIQHEREQAKYKKHFDLCMETLLNIVDFATKIGEYRELTNKLLPSKLMREWTALFVEGKPLYEEPVNASDVSVPDQAVEEERQRLLNEGDFNEYTNMTGSWQPPEETGITGPPKPNAIIGHIVQRLFDIVQPPVAPSPPPEFPSFPIKACILGKTFSGKTACLQRLAEERGLVLLDAEKLVSEAIMAYNIKETLPTPEPTNEPEEFVTASPVPKPTGGVPANAETDTSGAVGPEHSEKPVSVEQPDNRELEEAAAAAAAQHDDGAEKGDDEKPVTEDSQDGHMDVMETNEPAVTGDPEKPVVEEKPMEAKATPRAIFGGKASKLLKRGKPIEDSLLVDIIVEAIRSLPEGRGWILDGFPTTYSQAKLLEKALSGLDSEGREQMKASLKKSVLAPDPHPKPTPPEPPSAIDIIILLDVPDELCLKRAAGRYLALQKGEISPPANGLTTGMSNQEQVVPIKDEAFDQEQLQHRLTTFQDAWPKLQKWFAKFGTLRQVDGTQEQETVFLEVEKLLDDIVNKDKGNEAAAAEATTPQPQAPPTPTPSTPQEEAPATEKKPGSRAESVRSRPSSRDKDGKKSAAGKASRAETTAKSPKRGKSPKKGKTPEPEPEPEPEVSPGTPPPAPGSEQWEFVNQPVQQELDPWDPDNLDPWFRDKAKEVAGILAKHWETVENTYIDGTKFVFRQLRDEREKIIRYFYSIRRNFEAFLRRPDHKQEFVSQWQKEYNSLADDLRGDEETKMELHQRVDDLRERLWSICDERKEQAEAEREGVINEGWLDDHLGLLTNHYLSLMQNEVDRYQDSTRMLQDYYKTMDGRIPSELQTEYARIPLVELAVEDRPASASDTGSKTGSAKVSPKGSRTTSPKSPISTTPTLRRKTITQSPVADHTDEQHKKRIPLVPRRGVSPDLAAASKGGKADKGKVGGKGGKSEGSETPQPPNDPDEKLIFYGFLTAAAAVDKILQAEQAAREAEEEAERQAQLEREKEKAGAGGKKGAKGGGKKGKSRSPSPKKGAKDGPAPTPPPQEEESEEDKERKLLKEKAKVEYFAAIEEEAVAVKMRLELIKAVTMNVLQDLKHQAEEAYKDMNDWLGARFLKEMASIDQMSEVVRNAIEEGRRIQHEVVLQQDEFLIHQDINIPPFDKDVRVLRTPTPEPRPPAVEKAPPEDFTVDQILHLHSQFTLTAPKGVISAKAFQDMFIDLAMLTYGTEQLPEAWLNISNEKLEQLSQLISTDGEYIDWRAFLLAAAEPWPKPTQQELLSTLQEFRGMDQLNTGYVTRQQYDRVELWFRGMSKPPSPNDPQEPYPYDRLYNIKTAFFDIFADNNMDPPQLDYVNMLLYFSVASDAYEGLLKALSVATGKHMPRPKATASDKQPSRPPSQTSIADMTIEETEGIADDIPESANYATVPLDTLDRVLHHGQSLRGDSHRFSVTADPQDAYARDRLQKVYDDLGCENYEEGVLFSVLVQHPIIQDIIAKFNTFKLMDLHGILNSPNQDPETQEVHLAE